MHGVVWHHGDGRRDTRCSHASNRSSRQALRHRTNDTPRDGSSCIGVAQQQRAHEHYRRRRSHGLQWLVQLRLTVEMAQAVQAEGSGGVRASDGRLRRRGIRVAKFGAGLQRGGRQHLGLNSLRRLQSMTTRCRRAHLAIGDRGRTAFKGMPYCSTCHQNSEWSARRVPPHG